MSDELQRSNMPFLIGIVNFETRWQIIDDLQHIASGRHNSAASYREYKTNLVLGSNSEQKMRAISLIILIIGYVASAGVNKMLCKSGELILSARCGMVATYTVDLQ